LALVMGTGCSHAGGQPARVLTLGSADPAGIEHAPAVQFFVDRVAKLSGGRLRIVVDQRWAPDRETALLRGVGRGATDLAWAHTRSLEPVGVRNFVALDAPMLVDSYGLEHAVLRSSLASSMLAATRSVGLRGLAVLAGPLSRLVGVGEPLRRAADLRGVAFGVHDLVEVHGKLMSSAGFAPRALRGFGVVLSPANVDALYANPRGGSAAFEDDLDSLFFDRHAGACPPNEDRCAAYDPWVTANVVLWARPAVLVANPGRFAALPPRERAWIEEAASQAAAYSLTLGHGAEQQLVPELCAAGVRIATASRADVASIRRPLARVYAQLERSPGTRAAIRRIRRLRANTRADEPLAAPAACGGSGSATRSARGVRSSLPDGVYRARITERDLRAAEARGAGVRAGLATLTLRGGRWRLVFTEPGRTVQTGTYAGTPLRTTWAYDGDTRNESFFSVVVGRGGDLRFHVVTAFDLSSAQATYASHVFERIDG
jgi:TRAP-type C4-dicarboxylate transport system substrate-binding protein